ncbi:hypothetical protein DFH07DRAFT_960636 [Mycena maculata]|uniref:Protein kinase domain-containing protein n=1 Tax=Mycena maculata TaxID=230809 RepID=A0AAD7IYW3_9AGAR|nr:hypothetical protein DFH07DRAFT_960636 [Mycena maculata]
MSDNEADFEGVDRARVHAPPPLSPVLVRAARNDFSGIRERHPNAGVLDAIRISDGAEVVLKFVGPASRDTKIYGYLSTDPGARNHCLPMLELLHIEDPEYSEPSIEFIQQVLEGLVFLHRNNIAHRTAFPFSHFLPRLNLTCPDSNVYFTSPTHG